MNQWFASFALWATQVMGSSWAFILSVVATLIWLVSGPWFGFNEDWNFWANTSTTVITFLMIFLVQHAQNRGDRATHLKLDELLRAVKDAHNDLIDAEGMTEEELDKHKQRLKAEVTG